MHPYTSELINRIFSEKKTAEEHTFADLIHNVLTRKTASIEKTALGEKTLSALKEVANENLPRHTTVPNWESNRRHFDKMHELARRSVNKMVAAPETFMHEKMDSPMRRKLHEALAYAAMSRAQTGPKKVAEDHTFAEHLKKNLKSIGSKALVGGAIAGTAGGAIYAAKKIMEGHRRRVDEKARAGELSQFTRENPDIDPAIAAKHHAMIRELAPVLSKNKDALRDVIRAHARAGNPVSVSDLKDLAEMQNMHEETVRSRSNPTHELLSNIRV
jgi:hypothetical protein